MTDTKHTPGPWFERDGDDYVYGANNRAVALPLADLGNFKELYANAHLISAAPDLLDALEICVNFGRAYADATDDKWLRQAVLNDVAKAEAAIAKAKGAAQ